MIAGPCGQVVTSSQMVTSSQVVTWQSDDILIVMGWAGESSVQPGTEQGGLITLDRLTTTHHTGPSCPQQQLMLRGPASVVGVVCGGGRASLVTVMVRRCEDGDEAVGRSGV